MALFEDLPFERGTTFYNGGTIDTADLPTHLEGREFVVNDIDPASSTNGTKTARTGKKVRLRIVRNSSTIALLPKRLVKYDTSAGALGGRVDGYTTVTADDWAGVVDEFLPSAGVPANDYFYIAVAGPTNCLMPLSNLASDVARGDRLVAITGATSQCTTSGRITAQTMAFTEAVLGNQVQNVIGRALTAKLTSNTGDDILVDLVTRL